MNTEEMKKLAVVSVDDGAKLGYVDDLLFDTTELRVAALVLSTEGQHAVIAMSDVRSVGGDAVTVQNGSAVHSLSADTALAQLPGMERLTKLKVVDESGDYIGRLNELDFDPQSGKVTDVRTHEGGVLGIGGKNLTIQAADIRSVGDELMVVAAQPAST